MKRLCSFLLCLCLVIGLLPSSASVLAASDEVSKVQLTIDKPVDGNKPSAKATLPSGVSTRVTSVDWEGNLDAEGKFKMGEDYTVRIGVEIKESVDKIFASKLNVTVNSKKATKVEAVDEFHIVVSYAFPATSGVIGKVAVTIKEPAAGETPSMEAVVTELSDVYVKKVEWKGTLDADGKFKPKENYTVTITLGIKNGAGLIFTKSTKLTLNSKIQSEKAKKENEFAVSETWKDIPYPKDVRDPESFYTIEEADALYWAKHQIEKVVDRDTLTQFDNIYDNTISQKYILGSVEENHRVTKVIYNYPKIDVQFMLKCDNLTEIWLGPEADAVKFLEAFRDLTRYESIPESTSNVFTWDCVVFIPEEQEANIRKNLYEEREANKVRLGKRYFRTMLYSGDVYAAAKKGISAARDWCTDHVYTDALMVQDRRLHYVTCQQGSAYCHSCIYCGKPEYDEAHIFSRDQGGNDNSKVLSYHSMSAKLLTDAAYIGTNEKGEKVYAKSCEWCGISEKEIYFSYSREEFNKAIANGGLAPGETWTYEQEMERRKEIWDTVKVPSMLKATQERDTVEAFAVSDKSAVKAKVSAAAQSEVNWANEYGLLDTALLGNDYSKGITRLQLASLAVKLAESMTGKAIDPSAGGTFTDTDSIYAKKAVAAGIMEGAAKFDPNGSVDRQRMATAFYQALQYVKNNSVILYTPYEEKLEQYSDSKDVAGWAKEAMGFMEALGLLEGVDGNKLLPAAKCTIEEAVLVARHSLDADVIGWYQHNGKKGLSPDRVWILGPADKDGYYPSIDIYNGEVIGRHQSYYKPIKDGVNLK